MPNEDDYFALWFPLGVLMGISIVGLVVLFVDATDFPAWVNRYQALIAAALAIATAWWTVNGTFRATKAEINQSQQSEEIRRIEQLRAARALMPFALTEITAFCQGVLSQLSDVMNHNAPSSDWGSITVLSAGPSFKIPKLPISALKRIRNVIKYSTTDDAKEMSLLLSKTQILAARLEQIQEYNETGFLGKAKEYSVLGRALDALELHARANRSFKYARFEAEQLPHHAPEQKDLINSIVLTSPP